jgi:putative endonuclease
MRQMARIASAAAEFLGHEPQGQLTPARFDVALVDACGSVEILENAFAA